MAPTPLSRQRVSRDPAAVRPRNRGVTCRGLGAQCRGRAGRRGLVGQPFCRAALKDPRGPTEVSGDRGGVWRRVTPEQIATYGRAWNGGGRGVDVPGGLHWHTAGETQRRRDRA
ncbi:hypothetical protein NDU88_002857 [Pleurodeles waltl]|uniref:Uncharacterized protein n=1 Tax=Pleurodeles waltl TaxID=8319 RepID=A0AAV7P855_PLEWA|nr:hypothetical protein NDU88_002857 [Pleurodeles waltl]